MIPIQGENISTPEHVTKIQRDKEKKGFYTSQNKIHMQCNKSDDPHHSQMTKSAVSITYISYIIYHSCADPRIRIIVLIEVPHRPSSGEARNGHV